MAMHKAISLDSGLMVDDAYHRVEGIYIQAAGEMRMNVQVATYKDKSAAKGADRRPWVLWREYAGLPFDKAATDPIVALAYRALKDMAEFADAIDV